MFVWIGDGTTKMQMSHSDDEYKNSHWFFFLLTTVTLKIATKSSKLC